MPFATETGSQQASVRQWRARREVRPRLRPVFSTPIEWAWQHNDAIRCGYQFSAGHGSVPKGEAPAQLAINAHTRYVGDRIGLSNDVLRRRDWPEYQKEVCRSSLSRQTPQMKSSNEPLSTSSSLRLLLRFLSLHFSLYLRPWNFSYS